MDKIYTLDEIVEGVMVMQSDRSDQAKRIRDFITLMIVKEQNETYPTS